jgi:hypothetical protein
VITNVVKEKKGFMKDREDVYSEVIQDYHWISEGTLDDDKVQDFIGFVVDNRMKLLELQTKHDHL